MAQLQRDSDKDREDDASRAYQAAQQRSRLKISGVGELQKVARMIGAYCGTKGGQRAALKTLADVRVTAETNFWNLACSIRDAGRSAIDEFLEEAQAQDDDGPSAEEWQQNHEVCGLLREALAIGADARVVERVRRAIKTLEAE